MQKVGFILFLVVLNAGCAVFKNRVKKDAKVSKEINSETLFEGLKRQNLTVNNFFIQKAEIEFSIEGKKKKLLGSIKFNKPDKYLISIKSITGIEGARIFISDDTVFINDRINKKQYYGSSKYITNKFGVPVSVFPVVFGDYINDNLANENPVNCLDGKLNIDGIVKGAGMKYIIDCREGKSILGILENDLDEKGIEFNYDEFLNSGDARIPGKIKIVDYQRRITIEIKIIKIVTPWTGDIEFIPGKNYELIQIR